MDQLVGQVEGQGWHRNCMGRSSACELLYLPNSSRPALSEVTVPYGCGVAAAQRQPSIAASESSPAMSCGCSHSTPRVRAVCAAPTLGASPQRVPQPHLRPRPPRPGAAAGAGRAQGGRARCHCGCPGGVRGQRAAPGPPARRTRRREEPPALGLHDRVGDHGRGGGGGSKADACGLLFAAYVSHCLRATLGHCVLDAFAAHF